MKSTRSTRPLRAERCGAGCADRRSERWRRRRERSGWGTAGAHRRREGAARRARRNDREVRGPEALVRRDQDASSRRPRSSRTRRRRSACSRRPARCTSRRSIEPGRSDQVLRSRSSSSTPHNADAITRLKEMYEKRRDWEKLVRVMEREAELLGRARPRASATSRWRSSRPSASASPRSASTSGRRCSSTIRRIADALTRARGPLRARARMAAARGRARARRSSDATRPRSRRPLLTKLGMIYADKLNDDRGAVSAFQRLLTLDPDDRRAQEQLKRRYVAIKAWDDLEDVLRAERQVGRADPHVRARGRQQGRAEGGAASIAALPRRAPLAAQEKDDRARARRTRRCSSSTPQNLDGSRRALADLRGRERREEARRRLRGPAQARRPSRTERIALLRETGLLYEERLKQAETAFERYLEALLARRRWPSVLREDVERVAPAVERLGSGRRGVPEAIEAAPSEDDQHRSPHARSVACSRRSGRSTRRSRSTAPSTTRSSDHMGAIAALERLYRQTSQVPASSSTIYDRRIELETRSGRASHASRTGAPSLFENELTDADQRRSTRTRAILAEWGDEEQDAYRALDATLREAGRWQDSRRRPSSAASISDRASDEELASLKFRLARVLEQHLGRKPEAARLMSEVVTLAPGARRRAPRARGRSSPTPRSASRLRASSSRSTRSAPSTKTTSARFASSTPARPIATSASSSSARSAPSSTSASAIRRRRSRRTRKRFAKCPRARTRSRISRSSRPNESRSPSSSRSSSRSPAPSRIPFSRAASG